MQEHIRRAHPEHYIPKLPATEESFQLMITTPPSERPPPPPNPNITGHGPYIPQTSNWFTDPQEGYGHDLHHYDDDSNAANTPRNLDEYNAGSMLPAASAAAALAQLHNYKVEPEWDSENVSSKNLY